MSRCLLDFELLQETFKTERRYLKNVTPKTLSWYHDAFRAFAPFLNTVDEERELKPALKNAVIAMAGSGRKAITVNTYICALNAFLRWLNEEQHITVQVRIPLLKQERECFRSLLPMNLNA
jgi:integrase